MKHKPNGILMAEAMMDEQKAAQLEQRECSSSNAIRLFQERKSGKRLSDDQATELFEIVFPEFCRVTGATVVRVDGQNITCCFFPSFQVLDGSHHDKSRAFRTRKKLPKQIGCLCSNPEPHCFFSRFRSAYSVALFSWYHIDCIGSSRLATACCPWGAGRVAIRQAIIKRPVHIHH